MENQPLPLPPSAPASPAAPENPPVVPKPPYRPNRFVKIAGVTIAVVALGAIGFIIFLVVTTYSGVSNYCSSSIPRQVHTEEQRQEAALNKVTILTGHKTDATASGNTDCVDGGPASVSASGDMAAAGTYASIRQDVDNNLAQAGYAQSGSIDPQDSHGQPDNGRATFNGLRVKYKNTKNDYIEVTYNFTTAYPYICSNGSKICNYPDLQSVQNAPISGISFDNLAPAYETAPPDRQNVSD